MADVVKYGIQIPNRVFVGGVAFDTKEEELKDFFDKYGKVKECKIVKDNQNISRGFAFVTFECKHDAIQTQQLGTVFFNQKKLNLGPAIRQKGVVFNGTKEVENEPILSTGVYIHPSGYSYTVAPNGVWYFHSADGTPPTVTPGAPPMAYTSNIVEKTRFHARCGSSGSSTSRSVSPDLEHPANLPAINASLETSRPVNKQVFPSNPYQVTYFQQNPQSPIHSHHHNHNLHMAFRNMSLSPQAQQHNVSLAQNGYPPSNSHIRPVAQFHAPHSPHPQYQHNGRVPDMYVPYYVDHGKVGMQSYVGGENMQQMPDYPYHAEPSRPAYIYANVDQPQHIYLNDMHPSMYKKMIPKGPMLVAKLPQEPVGVTCKNI